jgi:FkbM family methyltransferase
MYNFFKKLYFLIPFKFHFFKCLKFFYTPSLNIAAYLKFKGIFKLSLNHKKSVLIVNDNTTLPSLFFWRGLDGYEAKSIKLWIHLSQYEGNVFDLGANIGLFGLFSKEINRNNNIYLFEPLIRNVARIKKNFSINELSADIENFALSNFEGETVFFDSDSNENTIGSLSREFVEKHNYKHNLIPIKTKVITIDRYVEYKQINCIDLIKIDVEGVDFEVIEGSINSLKKFKPVILIEITDDLSAEKINKLFELNNIPYHFYEIDEKKGLIKVDSLKRSHSRNFLFITDKDLYKIENFC